jgi:hypothetical protein
MDKKTPSFDRILGIAAKRSPKHPAGDCPAEDLIAAYLEGILRGDALDRLEAHVAGCEECRAVLVEAALAHEQAGRSPLRLPASARFRGMPKTNTQEGSGVLELIYRTGRDLLERVTGLGTVQVLAPAPVRGDVSRNAYRLALSGLQVDASVDRQENGKFEVWLRVLADTSPRPPCEWQLWSDDRLLEQQPADGGEVLFSDLGEGSYRCVLRFTGREVGVMKLTIEEEAD